MARPDPSQSPRGFGNGCYGSVLLDNELWQELSALNGHDVPWVHGCVLENGHDGDHGAPAHPADEESQQWLRWRLTGPARIQRVEPSPPGRHSTEGGPTPGPQTPPQPAAVRAPAPATGSQVEALWAIAAAIDRLADAIAERNRRNRDDPIAEIAFQQRFSE